MGARIAAAPVAFYRVRGTATGFLAYRGGKTAYVSDLAAYRGVTVTETVVCLALWQAERLARAHVAASRRYHA